MRFLIWLRVSRCGHDNRTCGARVGGDRYYQQRVESPDSRQGCFKYEVRLLASKGVVAALRRVNASARRYRGISVDGRGKLFHVTDKGEHVPYVRTRASEPSCCSILSIIFLGGCGLKVSRRFRHRPSEGVCSRVHARGK